MNKCIFIGRLTKDPEVRVTNGGKKVARYTLALDRIGEGADFVSCVAWEKAAEFAEKYLTKGMKISVEAHVQTGNYKDKDGKTVYTTDFIIERHEFCERKTDAPAANGSNEGWLNVPDGVVEDLPFN